MSSNKGQDPVLPPDNLHHVVITATCFAFILSTTAVGLRLYSRHLVGSRLFLDDYLMIGALGLSVSSHSPVPIPEFKSNFAIPVLYNGLGTHITQVPPDQLTVYLKTLASGSFLYTACVACIKLSIVNLYKRLFPVKPMPLAADIVASIVFLWGFGVIVISGATCIPFQKLWMPTIPGGCINLPKLYYGSQIPNIVTDAIILVMPVKVVWNLHVSKTRKSLLLGIFTLGLLTLIFDVVRLATLIELSKKGMDTTYNQVPASVWTCIEPAIGIVTACLPNMGPLLQRVPRKFWIRMNPSSSENSDQERGTPIARIHLAGAFKHSS